MYRLHEGKNQVEEKSNSGRKKSFSFNSAENNCENKGL